MRIIAGRFKGIRIPSPRKGNVRPTTDRVREALFSILGSAVDRANVLDLFAGTGTFGFEALSRGASSVVFVDHDRDIARILGATAKALGIEGQVRILNLPVSKAAKHLREAGNQFGIVFLDPPYGEQVVPKLFAGPDLPSLLEPEGLLVVESEANAPECAAPSALRRSFSRRYGDTLIEIYVRDSEVR